LQYISKKIIFWHTKGTKSRYYIYIK